MEMAEKIIFCIAETMDKAEVCTGPGLGPTWPEGRTW
jgi:hypothetical protein